MIPRFPAWVYRNMSRKAKPPRKLHNYTNLRPNYCTITQVHNMTKPNRLQAALREKAQGDTAKPTPVETPTATPKATTRKGKVMVSGWLPLEAKSSFRLIQAKYPEKLMQDLVTEALMTSLLSTMCPKQ